MVFVIKGPSRAKALVRGSPVTNPAKGGLRSPGRQGGDRRRRIRVAQLACEISMLVRKVRKMPSSARSLSTRQQNKKCLHRQDPDLIIV